MNLHIIVIYVWNYNILCLGRWLMYVYRSGNCNLAQLHNIHKRVINISHSHQHTGSRPSHISRAPYTTELAWNQDPMKLLIHNFLWYVPIHLWKSLIVGNQIALIGSCDRSRIPFHDLGVTSIWSGENKFHKMCKIFENFTGYLIIFLKSKWNISKT